MRKPSPFLPGEGPVRVERSALTRPGVSRSTIPAAPSILLNLQRLAGNAATAAFVEELRATPHVPARDPGDVGPALQRACGRDVLARNLAAEIRQEQKTGIGKKELQEYLEQKDALVPGGQHHRKRNVSAGQIAGDLESFADSHNQ
jgi:hypothetical protein